jgi:hypothetical protein
VTFFKVLSSSIHGLNRDYLRLDCTEHGTILNNAEMPETQRFALVRLDISLLDIGLKAYI